MKMFYKGILLIMTMLTLAGCKGEHSGFPTDPDVGNTAPQALSVEIHGDVNETLRPGMTLFLSGEYYDKEGDVAGSHLFRWLRNGIEVSGMDDYKYKLTSPDSDSVVSGCVTPIAKTGTIAGLEVCTEVVIAPEEPNIVLSDPPSAVVTINKDKLFLSGADIHSQYRFIPGLAGDTEGNSLFLWVLLSNNMPKVTTCPAGERVDCIETIPEDIVGSIIESCVLPVASRAGVVNPVPGMVNCDEAVAAGFSLGGSLNYRDNLVAQIDGFPAGSTYHWYVDIADNQGPINDTVTNEIASGNVSDFASGAITYNIGGIESVDVATYDSNGNGVIDDRDFNAAGNSISGMTHAGYMLGKDVKICVKNTGFAAPDDERCILASQADDVSGGIYYDSSDITKRGIAPATVVVNSLPVTAINLAADTTFSRPISNAEYELREALGYGADLPMPDRVETYVGMEWIRYTSAEPSSSPASKALKFCLNLSLGGSDNWNLPVSSDTHNTDSHSGSNGGNNAPTDSGRNLKGLADVMMYNMNQIGDNQVSPTWGWPLQQTYSSATAASRFNNQYDVNLATGAAQGFSSNTFPRFVSCVLSD